MDQREAPEPEMHRRKIELPDGRYLLFYTFDVPDTPFPVEPVKAGEEEPTDT